MIPHDILTLYTAKMIEYGIAVMFLLLFIPFWRFVQARRGRRMHPPAAAPGGQGGRLVLTARGSALPPRSCLARADASGTVTIGLNDFAAHLVGPVSRISMPAVGARSARANRPGACRRRWPLGGDALARRRLGGRDQPRAGRQPRTGHDGSVRQRLADEGPTEPVARQLRTPDGSRPPPLDAGRRGGLCGHDRPRPRRPGPGRRHSGRRHRPDARRGRWDIVAGEFLLTAEETRHA